MANPGIDRRGGDADFFSGIYSHHSWQSRPFICSRWVRELHQRPMSRMSSTSFSVTFLAFSSFCSSSVRVASTQPDNLSWLQPHCHAAFFPLVVKLQHTFPLLDHFSVLAKARRLVLLLLLWPPFCQKSSCRTDDTRSQPYSFSFSTDVVAAT